MEAELSILASGSTYVLSNRDRSQYNIDTSVPKDFISHFQLKYFRDIGNAVNLPMFLIG